MTATYGKEYKFDIEQYEDIKRFQNRIGYLGLSSGFLYRVMMFHVHGVGTDNDFNYIYHPYDYDDFSRIGLLIIGKPEWKPYLEIMRTYSSEWYNIVENWDILIYEHFYSYEMSTSELTNLLQDIMKIPNPGKPFQSDYIKWKQTQSKYAPPVEPPTQLEPAVVPEKEADNSLIDELIEILTQSPKQQEVNFDEDKEEIKDPIIENHYHYDGNNNDNDNNDNNDNNEVDYMSDDELYTTGLVEEPHQNTSLLNESRVLLNESRVVSKSFQPHQPENNNDFLMQSVDCYSVKKTNIPENMQYPQVKNNSVDEQISYAECREIADQLVENFNVLVDMKIPAQVAELIIPKIIKKTKGHVNITWTNECDWQLIYRNNTLEYDVPHRNVAGYLQINEPTNAHLETKEAEMISADKERLEMDELIKKFNMQDNITE